MPKLLKGDAYMKYFTSELWAAMHTSEDQENIFLEWKKNDQEYENYLKEIKNYLPLNFLDHYHKNEGFHDFEIRSLSVEETNKLKMTLRKDAIGKAFLISFQPISECTITIRDKENMICGKLGWGYCEFELVSPDQLKLSILCDISNEISVTFKLGENNCEVLELNV